MTKSLTPKQEQFAQNITLCQTQSDAYRNAFGQGNMSDKTINEKASKLMALDKVKARVGQLQEETAKRNEISIDKVVKELALIAFQDPREMFDKNTLKDITDLDEETARVLAEVTVRREKTQDGDANVVETVKLKTYDKTKALDMLMKHLGGYEKDNKQKDNQQINFIRVEYITK